MNREQCKGCAYFLSGAGGKKDCGYMFCHYMLFTGERRKVGENEICLSRSEKKIKATAAFEVLTKQM